MKLRFLALVGLTIAFTASARSAPAISFSAYAESLRAAAVAAKTPATTDQLQRTAIALFEYLEGPANGGQIQTTVPLVKGVFVDLYVPPPDQTIVYVKRGSGPTSKEYGFSFDKQTAVLRSVTFVVSK